MMTRILAASAAALLVSSAAHALDITLSLTDDFGLATATYTPGDANVNATVGQTIELTVTVANPGAEDIFSVFSFLTQTNTSGLTVDVAGPANILINPGNPPFVPLTQLTPVGSSFGQPAAGQPPGTLVAVAHSGGGSSTDGTGPDAAVVLIMEVTNADPNTVGQQLLTANGASSVNLNGGLTINVPELGSLAASGTALASVFGVVCVRRRQAEPSSQV